MSLGAEKWVDFRETKDLVKDVIAATDGLGAHAEYVASNWVHTFPVPDSIDLAAAAAALLQGAPALLPALQFD